MAPLRDEEADQSEPLLRDDDSYSLSSLNDDGLRDEDEYVRDAHLPKRAGSGNQQHKIKPIFPRIQALPLNLIQRLAPSTVRKAAILSAAIGFWIAFIVFLTVRTTVLPPIPGYGIPRRLSCYSTYWSNNVESYSVPSCDTTEPECASFLPPPFAFQCPPDCADAHLQEEHYLGNRFIEHDIWVIGGADSENASHGKSHASYRADSYICGAAIHAGVIKNRAGGCGILTMDTGAASFLGSSANGIESMDFNSSFPFGYTLAKVEKPNSRCYKLEWMPFTVSVLLTIGISLFTTSPEIFFFSIYTIVFFQISLISDAPNFDDYLRVVQTAFSRFLPSAFVGFAIYKFCVQKTLTGLDAQMEKTILWLGGCWFGSLDNYTLDRLPLSRLTPHDLAEPGAIIVLLCVVSAIIAAAGTQAWAFWRDGRFWKYLTIYGTMASALLILAFVPGFNLRIHHYILALLLLPGTAIQTRPSLLFQGFLVGLFINGVARWGYASIIETDQFLAREGQLGSVLPEFLAPIVNHENITFTFASLSPDWDGLSVMVNDIERTRVGRAVHDAVFAWTRLPDEDTYFRFAYVKAGYIGGTVVGDYTKPGTWLANGTWSAWSAS